jgi:hypothetical protein
MATHSSVLDDLITITGRLADLMARENEILHSMRPSDIRELQKDKADLAQSYERRMRLVREDPTILAGAPSALRETLLAMTTRFEEVLTENERSLRAVRTVSERVMKVIVDAANDQHYGAPAYSSAGVMTGASAASGRRTVAVTFNKQL